MNASRRRTFGLLVASVAPALALVIGSLAPPTSAEVPQRDPAVERTRREVRLLDDIYKNGVVADDFSLYLHHPTATDPAMAPEGCSAFYVLSPVPHLGVCTDWRQQAEPYRRTIEARLAAAGITDRVSLVNNRNPGGAGTGAQGPRRVCRDQRDGGA